MYGPLLFSGTSMNRATAEVPQAKTPIEMKVLGGLLFACALGFAAMIYTLGKREDPRWKCVTNGPPLQSTTGTVRMAGGSFMLVNEKWRMIDFACAARNRERCMKTYPHRGLLESRVGHTISAQTCNGRIVSIELDGRTYSMLR
ncbi:hypothetical protein [Paracidovorax avenae]|uniref:hypothetical protein n=1 Tax=Paracidovorax avenae TaxID=80867 RepID=UPI001260337D|nr:hypothetical protein [Paracidovorax avenae]